MNEQAKETLAEALAFIERRNSGAMSVFEEAGELIYGDREKTYGDPSKNLARIAEMWTAYLQKNLRETVAAILLRTSGTSVTPERLREITKYIDLSLSVTDVCRMMQHLKQSRDENNPKRDNVVDDIGYAGLVHRCRTPLYERSIPSGVASAANGVDEVRKQTSKRKPQRKR